MLSSNISGVWKEINVLNVTSDNNVYMIISDLLSEACKETNVLNVTSDNSVYRIVLIYYQKPVKKLMCWL